MIVVRRSPTADTRTCDYAGVSAAELFRASEQHIADVRAALALFQTLLAQAAEHHDADKPADIDGYLRRKAQGEGQKEDAGRG